MASTSGSSRSAPSRHRGCRRCARSSPPTGQLLAGEKVTIDGEHVHLDGVQLAHPAQVMPPISLGVRGPRSMALAGEVADGVIFAEWSGPRYLQQVREQIGEAPKFTAFVQASADVEALEAMMEEKMALPRFASATVRVRRRGGPRSNELVIAGDPSHGSTRPSAGSPPEPAPSCSVPYPPILWSCHYDHRQRSTRPSRPPAATSLPQSTSHRKPTARPAPPAVCITSR